MTATNTVQGHVLTVLRPADGHDCTLGGMSSLAAEVAGVPPRIQHRTPTPEAPAVFLRIRTSGGEVLLSIEPATGLVDTRPWSMFGGNYAASPAPEWQTLIGGNYGGAIPIHDRVER